MKTKKPGTEPNKVAQKLLKDIITQGLFEDRREYDADDLMTAYQIDQPTATRLYILIQEQAHS